jgi:hypothetical protein
MQHIIEPVLMKFTDLPKLDASGKPIINGMNGVLDMSRPIGKVLKPKGYLSKHWEILEKKTNSDYRFRATNRR